MLSASARPRGFCGGHHRTVRRRSARAPARRCSPAPRAASAFEVIVQSFGFKYGIPPESDLVFDVRFLPNPYYEMSLRERNGTDPEVRDYVFQRRHGGCADALSDRGMIDFLLPRYMAEGKANLIISIGCTGGKHRSVAIAEALSEHLRRSGIRRSHHAPRLSEINPLRSGQAKRAVQNGENTCLFQPKSKTSCAAFPCSARAARVRRLTARCCTPRFFRIRRYGCRRRT